MTKNSLLKKLAEVTVEYGFVERIEYKKVLTLRGWKSKPCAISILDGDDVVVITGMNNVAELALAISRVYAAATKKHSI